MERKVYFALKPIRIAQIASENFLSTKMAG